MNPYRAQNGDKTDKHVVHEDTHDGMNVEIIYAGLNAMQFVT